MRRHDDTQRLTAYERMLAEDNDNGVDVYAPNTVTVGRPQAPRDRTIPAAPLGWTPPPDTDDD